MHSILASSAVAALLLAVALADHHHHHHCHGEEMSCHKLSSPNADFAFALYKSLNAKAGAGKNIFYSPLGIATALSMLSVGARGDTHSQILSSLGYSSLSQAQVNEAYKHLLHILCESHEIERLDIINSVFVCNGFTPAKAYINDIKKYYCGEIYNIDFYNAEEAAAEVNRRIASITPDEIKDLVPIEISGSDMAMVLINYVFFSGSWEIPFDRNLTRKGEFQVDKSTKVEVDMMKKTGRFDYYQDPDNHTTVILLPYKGNTSMMIVLPDEGRMKEVEGFINKDYIRHWHGSLFKTNVNLLMPKFSIFANASLDETLKEMGMKDAFNDKADFSGMSEEIKLKVSKVSHKAVLSVDETGTEAASATTIEIMPMSMPENVELNRPFMLFIMEHSTRSFLFMGKINNPTAI